MTSVYLNPSSGPTEEATIAPGSFNEVDGMSPEGWNESDLGVGGVRVRSALRCAFAAEALWGPGGLPMQTQRRCSSKGSSVDSWRGVGWSPALGGVGSDI